jgi:hypothetical protein
LQHLRREAEVRPREQRAGHLFFRLIRLCDLSRSKLPRA